MLGALIGRLPIAALSLSTIILVRHETGSFAVAGVVEACVGIAAAVSLPVQGRLVDRYGQTAVLVPAAALNPIALVALVVAAGDGASSAVLAAIGALSGASFPAMSSCMRTLWSDLVPDPVLRQSAFALDAVLLEVCFIVGPLATGALVGAGWPAAAVLANAGFSTVGTLVFAATRASRSWRGSRDHARALGGPPALGRHSRAPAHRADVRSRRRRDGDLRHRVCDPPRIPWPCRRSDRGAGCGQHGGRPLVRVPAARDSGGQRYPRLCLFVALGFAPLILMGSVASAIPLMALSGFAFAPAGAVLYMLLDELAPPGGATEASTWLITAVVTGVAGGTAVGGAS